MVNAFGHTQAVATRELLDRAGTASDTSGIYHFSAPDTVSRLDFALRIFELAGTFLVQPNNWARISPTTTAEFPLPAQHPLRAVTSKDKLQRVFGITMPSWEKQLTDFMQDYSDRQPP
jgi:dTDP-4-dehydrorhamnose reductase